MEKILDLISAATIVVFVGCLLLIGGNSFPEVQDTASTAKMICWPMIVLIIGAFIGKAIVNPTGSTEEFGWQVMSILPLIGYALVLFSLS